ncbi:putative pectinesterase/pectinesterase inhibitor 28 [Acorus calamus]|uniref:Pectinesterase n=1 Tax=Acorus calamus TaxID=4465 RepID=A0AAV9D0G0_ACOCL|nr:putative pectinesterase/pectinesterase inhibitor 28 [Acorus calamus]
MQSSKTGYGQVSDQPRPPKKNKRIALLGASAVILVVVVIVIAVIVGVSHNHHSKGSSDGPSPSVKAIQAICQPTDYKEACESSLTAVAGSNTTDPKDLVKLSFKVALDRIRDAANHSSVLQKLKQSSKTGYGQVSDQPRPPKKNKRIALLGASAVILIVIVIAVVVGVSHNHHSKGSSDGPSPSVKAIQAICQPTDYKEACESSLTAVAGSNTTDPKDLVKLSFKVALDRIRDAANHSSVLQKLKQDPRTVQALENCRELMDYAIDDLKGSIEKLGGFDLTKLDRLMEDLSVWLSASITYQETCLDGFENTTGDAEESMRKVMKTGMELSSNTLAIPDVVVAKDGSGRFKTINEALGVIPKNGNPTFVVYIKAGVYKEYVEIKRSMTNVMFVGDGPTKTKITGNKNFIDGTPTFKTATVAVVGDGFIAKNIGFENSAGPSKHQAVALRVQSDMSVFHNCQVDGYQDTLYAHTNRQKDKREPTALILHNCTIVADKDYYPSRKRLPTYLGRPWKEYSRTFVMQSQIDDLVRPEGWQPWFGDFALNTCFYAEFDNRGPGAGVTGRVKWRGVKKVSWEHAQGFTVERFIQGTRWLPKTGLMIFEGGGGSGGGVG